MNKHSTASTGDVSLILRSGRSPGEENGYLLQYSYPENPMHRGAWQTTGHGVTNNQTQLNTYTHAHTSYSLSFSWHVCFNLEQLLSPVLPPSFLAAPPSLHTFNLLKKHLSVVPENMPQSICLCFLLESFHLFCNSYITCKLKVRAKDLITCHSFVFLISVHIKLCK